jgi:charged multivesicular body protein 7
MPSSREASTKNKKTKIEADVNDVLAIRTGEELVGALDCREWGRPVALAVVIQDAVQRKEMIPQREFLESKTGIYSKRWVPTPWEVVRWSLRQLGLVGGEMRSDRLAIGQFVVVENVEVCWSGLEHNGENTNIRSV